MENVELGEYLRTLANDVLVWVGFGTLVGLVAKAIMPGRDPGGALATLAMGIVGTVIGCGTVSFFIEGQRISPISPLGFVLATVGAFVLLLFYRVMAGFWRVGEDAHPLVPGTPGDVPNRRRRRRRTASYDSLANP